MQLKALQELETTQGTVQLISGVSILQQKNGIVLIPQPNNLDPNDPLNWSLVKRISIFYNVLLFSALTNFCITGIAPGLGLIAVEFGATTSQLTYLIAGSLLGEAMGCFVVAPLASKYGKRPVWLGCIVVFFICNVWAAVSRSYVSLLLARLFASMAGGTSEPLSVDTLNELFFLHERGTQAGVQGIWLSFGASFAPVISGFLIKARGWRWFHWLTAILSGINVITIFFCLPETQYPRDLHKAMDVAVAGDFVEHVPQRSTKTEAAISEVEGANVVKLTTTAESNPQRNYTKKTSLQDIKPWSPLNKDASLIGAFVRPWALWAYASVAWACLSFSIHVSAYVVLITLFPIMFAAPPYSFSESTQGLLYIASAIGNVIGGFVCGQLNDIISRRATRKNLGVFEPEMRLPVILFPAIVVPIGLVLAGVGFSFHLHWILPTIGLACAAAGLTGIPSVSQPYLLDSYYPVAMDCLIQFNGFKDFVSFGVGFAVIPWMETNGLIAMFSTLAAIVLVIDSGAFALYIYGKRLRTRDAQLKIFLF